MTKMPKWFTDLKEKAEADMKADLAQWEITKERDMQKAKANVNNIMANLQAQQDEYGRQLFGKFWDQAKR